MASAVAATSKCPRGFPLPTRGASWAPWRPSLLSHTASAGRGRTRMSAVLLETHPHSSLRVAENSAQDKALKRQGSACSGH